MKQKRTLYSLLLASFILVFAFSSLSAQTVTIGSANVLRCQPGSIDITVDVPADISAFEVIFEVTSASGGAAFTDFDVVFDGGLVVLTDHYLDLSGFDYMAGTGLVRMAGMLTASGDACLGAGQTVVGQILFNTNDVCGGVIEIVGADYDCQNGVVATTQFVDCAENMVVPATFNTGTISYANQPPAVAAIPNAMVHWGELFTYNVMATDGDDAACEDLTYAVSGADGIAVTGSGLITWTPLGSQVCTHMITVTVTDRCGDVAETMFEICVYNTPPTLANDGDPEPIIWGNTTSGTVTGFDPDGGPSALYYTVESFTGPGTVDIDPATGAWSWDTMEDNTYIGCHVLTIKVTDGANICEGCSPENSATVDVNICVIPTIRVTIEKTHLTYQGHNQDVSIFLDGSIDPAMPMGGFNFLVQYDASALSFNSATPGAFIEECGWEYFTYRYGADGNCDGGCPSGVLRVVAIAETNNGLNHPACFIGEETELVTLNFYVTDDRTFECQYVPIRFVWYDCTDNGISSVSGDTLFISRFVYDYMDYTGEITGVADYPTYQGAQDADCFVGDPDKVPLRLVDFFNGGIDIACADSIDARGDVNLNEIGYEIADAVLFSNYFVYGLSVFDKNLEGQIAATDVNADGLALSVADLVYLIRVVIGDAAPYPKDLTPVSATYSHASTGQLSVSDTRLGGAFVVVAGNTTPQLLAGNMDMIHNFDGTNTRILVYSLAGESFTGEFLNVSGDILSIEMATEEGYPVAAKLIPTEFALKQNYPNPFNPTTNISFDLPKSGDVTLAIYNVKGQMVTSFTDHYEAGTVNIEWDATNFASGVYFYRLQADNFSDTKKMVLLK